MQKIRDKIRSVKEPLIYAGGLINAILLPVLGWAGLQYMHMRDEQTLLKERMEQAKGQKQAQWEVLREIEKDVQNLKVDVKVNDKLLRLGVYRGRRYSKPEVKVEAPKQSVDEYIQKKMHRFVPNKVKPIDGVKK